MDDLEKIRRLTYVNAAIVLCSPGTARASEVHAALAEAGCPPSTISLHPRLRQRPGRRRVHPQVGQESGATLMARTPVDMRTFRHRDVTFAPKGPVLKVGSGETPVLPNPIERQTVVPLTARLFVGLSVGHAAAWTVEDVINVTQRVRTKQGADPDASFLLQRGLYTDRANEVVREDSVQVVIFSFGDGQERFEKQMGDLAEALIKELQQETIYVELQKAGVPYAVLKVT